MGRGGATVSGRSHWPGHSDNPARLDPGRKHSLYAMYSGDTTNAKSSSAPVTFTVQKGLPQVRLVAPASATSDLQVSLNASVTGNPANAQLPSPTGVVEFWDSLNGGAPQLLAEQKLTAGGGGSGAYAARLKLASGTHRLHVHYRGDTNWQATDSATAQLTAATFSLSISPNPIAMGAGSPGSGTVTITPSGGFVGPVALTCATGGTFLPAGYTCTFGDANPQVNNAVTTTTISFTPISTAAAAKTANASGNGGAQWGGGLGAGLLLLGFILFGSGETKNGRSYLIACGLLLCLGGVVWGCGGGGGGGGGGPVSTKTSITSSSLRVGFGTAVTFTVTVRPNGSATPSGTVQLYDNGQTYGNAVNVSAGIATFLATTLPVGEHNITSQYLGDANTLGSTSAPIAQAITGTVGLQISGTSSGITQTADFSVAVN